MGLSMIIIIKHYTRFTAAFKFSLSVTAIDIIHHVCYNNQDIHHVCDNNKDIHQVCYNNQE